MKKTLFGVALLLFFSAASGATYAQGKAKEANLAEGLKQALITYTKDLIAVIDKVKTVKDAEAAEPKMQKALDRLTSTCNALSDTFEKMTPEQAQAEAEKFESTMNDPQLEESFNKLEAAATKLKADHPAASEKLDEISDKGGDKFDVAVSMLLDHIQRMMAEKESGEVEEENSQGD